MATQTPVDEQTLVYSKLRLPFSVLQDYQDQARASGRTLEEFLSAKLTEMVSHTGTRAIYVDDKNRKELESVLKRNLSTPEAIVKAVTSLSGVKVGTVFVHIEETVNTRLRSRCPRNEPFEKYLTTLVQQLLEREVGLR